MKLRNKKTGEIVDTLCRDDITKGISFGVDHHDGNPTMAYYSSLAELNSEWEDYEEPKEYWYIDSDGELLCEPSDDRCEFDNNCREIGNYFETKEEAEKAVEKLKAWKRLKDNGFKFEGIEGRNPHIKFYQGRSYEAEEQCIQAGIDLDLLFGGEE